MAEIGGEGVEIAPKITEYSGEGSVAVLTRPRDVDVKRGGRVVQEPTTEGFDKIKWEPRSTSQEALARLAEEEDEIDRVREERPPRTPEEMRQALEDDSEAHVYFHQQKEGQLTVPVASD